MGPEQVWGVGSGLWVSVEGDCFRKDREDIGVVKEAGGRGPEKKTRLRRLPHKHAVLHSCGPGQGGWAALLLGMCQMLCSYFLILQMVRESDYVTCLKLPPKAD